MCTCLYVDTDLIPNGMRYYLNNIVIRQFELKQKDCPKPQVYYLFLLFEKIGPAPGRNTKLDIGKKLSLKS